MHIVNAKSCFIGTDPSFNLKDHYIELADGTMINDVAKQRGTILTQLKSKDGVYVDVKLSNVLQVPDFPQNICSVTSATSQGCKVNFSENNDELIAPNGTVFPIFHEARLITSVKQPLIQNKPNRHIAGTIS